MSELSQLETDKLYLREAYKLAKNSPDPSTQNGAVIVRTNKFFSLDDSNIVGRGYNAFPEGVEVNESRLQRPLKYEFIDHAETASIFDAAKIGKSTKGGIMYVPWFACSKCGISIVKAGIKEVIGSTWPEKWWKESRDNSQDGKRDWYKTIELAMTMFNEAGVNCRWVDGEIGNIEILFDGKLRRP